MIREEILKQMNKEELDYIYVCFEGYWDQVVSIYLDDFEQGEIDFIRNTYKKVQEISNENTR
ncbi:hypothetical protein [Cognatishimia sp.]|uniref:hypothetical protein n=1 Tax=Cognatishimia sp. TaxID=2211648 RepID=UPI003511B35F|nr:hypothetical protein [Cognatishimia sp.]